MNPIDSVLRIAREEVGVSKHIPITHLNSPTILEARNGSLFSVIKISGVPFDTEKTDTINSYKRAWHRAITALNEKFCVLGTIHRRKENIHLRGDFTNEFSKLVDEAALLREFELFDNLSSV